MEQDVSQAGTGTYADEIGFSNTPENYNDSTFSSGPSNIIGSENITTYPGTNITDTSNIYTGDDAYPLYGGAQTYNTIRGGTATNPYPESFWSKLFGAENVNYTNILGEQGVADLMNLRYNQAIGGRSQNPKTRGQLYQPRDYVVGAPTVMGEVKPMEGGIGNFFKNIIPGLSYITSPSGLPEGDKRYQQFLKDQEATDANVSGFSLSEVINDIKAGITNLFDYPKPVQDAVSNTMTESAFTTPPSMSEDFEVTRPVSNVFSEGDKGGDVYSEGIFTLDPKRASEIMGEPMLNTSRTRVIPNAPQLSDFLYNRQFEDFGVENPIVTENEKRMAPVTKTNVPLINPTMFDFQNMYTPEYMGNMYRAQTGL